MPKTLNTKAVTRHLGARVLSETLSAVEAIARRDGSSVTAVVQTALNQYVERDRAYREAHAAFIVDLSRDAALETLYRTAITQAAAPAPPIATPPSPEEQTRAALERAAKLPRTNKDGLTLATDPKAGQ